MMTMIFQPHEFLGGDPDHDANHAMRRIVVGIMMIFAVVFILMVMALYAFAGDPTGYWAREIADGRAPSAAWWQGLASRKGLCCSFADGASINDVDWDTKESCEAPYGGGGAGMSQVTICDQHFRVRLCANFSVKECSKDWFIVPHAAEITEPNRFGPAVVWPYLGADGTTQIRCFLPGALT
jgi:hypothetical protein